MPRKRKRSDNEDKVESQNAYHNKIRALSGSTLDLGDITVSSVSGVTLVPQSLGTSDSPTFAAETLSNATNQLTLGATAHKTIINATAPVAATQTVNIPDSGSATTDIVLADGNQTINGTKTFSANPAMTLSGIVTNGVMMTTGTGAVIASTMTDGQLLIGSTGNDPTKATLTATANQTTVGTGAGTCTIGTVQNIGTGSSPTFNGLTLTSLTFGGSGSGSQTPLDHNTIDGNSGTFTANGTASGSVTTESVKIGHLVHYSIPTVTWTSGSTPAASITSSLTVASAYRPPATVRIPCLVEDNGANTIGLLEVSSAGVIKVYKDATTTTNFTNATTVGFPSGIEATWYK